MNIYIEIALGVIALAAFCVSLVRFLHFFQLNSYRAAIHGKWLKGNISKYIVNIIFGLTALFSALTTSVVAVTGFIASMIIGAILSMPQKAKKPLVYTMRVKRLIITSVLMYVM